MTQVAGWCLSKQHRRPRCADTGCTCPCHELQQGAYHGVGTPTQIVLGWLVRATFHYGEGTPYNSDVLYLQALEKDGYAEVTERGTWRATPKGWGLYATKNERPLP